MANRVLSGIFTASERYRGCKLSPFTVPTQCPHCRSVPAHAGHEGEAERNESGLLTASARDALLQLLPRELHEPAATGVAAATGPLVVFFFPTALFAETTFLAVFLTLAHRAF